MLDACLCAFLIKCLQSYETLDAEIAKIATHGLAFFYPAVK